ncbi:MAG: CCA tRNA nucleotidyltransferase [Alphaproteobacteria bacterium]
MSKPDLSTSNWLHAQTTQDVITALTRDGATVRFVGGCVRDTLRGIEKEDLDLDIVTTDTPDRVTALLKKSGIRVLPIGIEYGTVMAVTGGKSFEITTLREDIQTFGRKAIVSYTTDFEKDAARRDFTINALYLSTDGSRIFDYFGGQEDLAAGRVRFIGDAAERIKEDRLRILRFFRFYAYCGKGAPDPAALKACAAAEKEMDILSAERVGRELLKLLAAPNPLPALQSMRETLLHFLPMLSEQEALKDFLEIEKTIGISDAIRRLAVLLNQKTDLIAFSNQLRLSKKEQNRIAIIQRQTPAPLHIKEEIYRFGKDTAFDKAFAFALKAKDIESLQTAQKICQNWQAPLFPVSGHDIAKMGFKGRALGVAKENLENEWIQCNFDPTREDLLQKLQEITHD